MCMEEVLKGVAAAVERIKKGEDFSKVAREEFDKNYFSGKSVNEAVVAIVEAKLNKNCNCMGCYSRNAVKDFVENSEDKEFLEFKGSVFEETKKALEKMGIEDLKVKNTYFNLKLLKSLNLLSKVFDKAVMDYVVVETIKSIIKENSPTNVEKGD